MYSVRQILKENWKDYIKTNNPTKHQREEVGKMLNCGENSCNSRICSSCGKRYADDWANKIKNLNPNKHIVLTVPSSLRAELRNWKNLDTFIKSSRDFFHKICEEDSGFSAILHTFGKDMKFNPHLHILANSKINFDQRFNKIWRKVVLDNLNSRSDKHYYGYYVWSNKGTIGKKRISKYIARYVRHPAIANGRIIKRTKNNIYFSMGQII